MQEEVAFLYGVFRVVLPEKIKGKMTEQSRCLAEEYFKETEEQR